MSERKNMPILHPGKTARDHESGAHARRWENQTKRKAWDVETTAKGPKGKRYFPVEVCNGRDTRSLRNVHKCGRPAIPGQKGGGACRHRKGKKA